MASNKNDLTGLRENYNLSKLLEEDLSTDPIKQFEIWISDAISSGVTEPNAMTLSTITKDGYPSGRVLLLKEVSSSGFVFYTNYKSSKAEEIERNAKVSLTFLWKALHRQVRIEGLATKVSREKSKIYFDSRPRESRIGAWVSPQSSKVNNREFLDAELIKFQNQFERLEDIPLPPNWGGYTVEPLSVEFWQGRESRLHDRLKYTKNEDETWSFYRLAP